MEFCYKDEQEPCSAQASSHPQSPVVTFSSCKCEDSSVRTRVSGHGCEQSDAGVRTQVKRCDVHAGAGAALQPCRPPDSPLYVPTSALSCPHLPCPPSTPAQVCAALLPQALILSQLVLSTWPVAPLGPCTPRPCTPGSLHTWNSSCPPRAPGDVCQFPGWPSSGPFLTRIWRLFIMLTVFLCSVFLTL